MSQQTVQQADRPKRPLGVWLLTLYAALVTGLLPAVVLLALLVIDSRSGTTVGADWGVALSLLLNLAVIISAVGAWRGQNSARRALLIFITIYYLLTALDNLLPLFSGELAAEDQIRALGRTLRGFLYPALYIWYFNQPSIKRFYQQEPPAAPSPL